MLAFAGALLLSAPTAPRLLPNLQLDRLATADAVEPAWLEGGPPAEHALYGIAGLGSGAVLGVTVGLLVTAHSTSDGAVVLATMTGGLLGAAAGGALGFVAGAGDELARRAIWQVCLLDCGIGAAAVAFLLLASLGAPYAGT